MSSAPKPASTIADSLRRSARGTQGFLDRLESLHASKRLSATDVTRAYESAFLSFYTELESHIERLFLGLLLVRIAPTRRSARSLVGVSSDRTARAVLGGDRGYADWLPIEKTAARASVFFSRGRPFDRLLPVDREVFERMHIVRNAIAHRSHRSLERFRRRLIEGQGIPTRQRTPAAYLRGAHSSNQTRLSYFMAQGVDAIDRICE